MEPNKRKTFQSPFSEFAKFKGMPFEILKEVDNSEYNAKEETGPVYRIKLSNGIELDAWPEEIFSGVGWEPIH